MIFRDTFGNLITNIHADRLAGRAAGLRGQVEIAGERIEGIVRTYGERPTGTLVALVGSSGWVEIAVVNGDAGRQLTAGAGTTVRLGRGPRASETGGFRRISRREFLSPITCLTS